MLDGSLARDTGSSTPLAEDEGDRLAIEGLLLDSLAHLSIPLFKLGTLDLARFRDRLALVVLFERDSGIDEGLNLGYREVGEGEEVRRSEARVGRVQCRGGRRRERSVREREAALARYRLEFRGEHGGELEVKR